MARPSKCRCICSLPPVTEFFPQGRSEGQEPVILKLDAYEVIRLLDYRHFTQEQCAARMNLSRSTVTRIYEEGRRQVAWPLRGPARWSFRAATSWSAQPPAGVRRNPLLPQAGKDE